MVWCCRRKGVSLLLECVFGLGIFVVSLLLLFSVFPTAQRSSQQARELSQGSWIARDLMEGVLARGYDLAVSHAPTVLPRQSFVNGVQLTTDYTYRVEVAPQGTANVKNVVVTVDWPSSSLPRQALKLQSYVADF